MTYIISRNLCIAFEGRRLVFEFLCFVCEETITLDAAGGRFFSDLEPIPGFAKHMEGGPKMSDPVLGLAEGVMTIPIPAREVSGEVVDTNL